MFPQLCLLRHCVIIEVKQCVMLHVGHVWSSEAWQRHVLSSAHLPSLRQCITVCALQHAQEQMDKKRFNCINSSTAFKSSNYTGYPVYEQNTANHNLLGLPQSFAQDRPLADYQGMTELQAGLDPCETPMPKSVGQICVCCHKMSCSNETTWADSIPAVAALTGTTALKIWPQYS